MRKLNYAALVAALFLTMVVGVALAGEPSNSVAVCGCGTVFVPDANTKYIEYEGHKYACCSDGCHAMAAKDPAAGAKMAQAATEKFMSMGHTKMTVANVIAVTESGTSAVCGCGKQFNIDGTTEYIKVEGESYACCSHACHELAAKDPASCAAAAKAKIKGMM